MNTSLIINSTDSNGKAYQKSISNINPEKENATLGEFAQMLNGLSTNTYVGASRIDKSDVTEEGGGSGGSSKQIATIAFSNAETIFPDQGGTPTIAGDISYNGDGTLYNLTGNNVSSIPNGYHLTYAISGSRAAYIIFAEETDNYSAAIFTY